MVLAVQALVLSRLVEIQARCFRGDSASPHELSVYFREQDRHRRVLLTVPTLSRAAVLSLPGRGLLCRLKRSRSRGPVLMGLSRGIMVDVRPWGWRWRMNRWGQIVQQLGRVLLLVMHGRQDASLPFFLLVDDATIVVFFEDSPSFLAGPTILPSLMPRSTFISAIVSSENEEVKDGAVFVLYWKWSINFWERLVHVGMSAVLRDMNQSRAGPIRFSWNAWMTNFLYSQYIASSVGNGGGGATGPTCRRIS
ncbi:hypothetical protein CRG98_018448 [Punica granatum]|uniref:Uncharacterized protein n=1 Tax=Punica granatum TaxID=22663 RepID=A0A2I0JXR5_PUNGR|nr:hypothetical protein CRG98_018448 [Punica granatum]